MAVYIAFDVETPNRANNRMSAIGISAIKDNKIVANFFSLVDPETHFDHFNTQLTGIDAEKVKGRSEFCGALEENRACHEQRHTRCP